MFRRRRQSIRRKRNPSIHKLQLEALDPRLVLAAVWDGGGDMVSWADPQNWENDELPLQGDDVLIETNDEQQIFVEGDLPSLNSLTLNAPFSELFFGNTSITVDDRFEVQAGTVVLQDASIGGGGTIFNQDMMITLGIVQLSTDFDQQGALIVENNDPGFPSRLILESNLINDGELLLSSFTGQDADLAIVDGGILENFGNIQIITQGDGQASILANVINHGPLTIDGQAEIVADTAVENFGDIVLQDPDVMLRIEAPSFISLAGGQVNGPGNVTIQSDGVRSDVLRADVVIPQGVVSPDSGSGDMIGELVVGFLDLGPASVLEFDIGENLFGPIHDQLLVEGQANFAGQIGVSLLDGFQPHPCQRFDIIRFESPSLDSPALNPIDIGNGMSLRPVAHGNLVSLIAVDNNQPINVFPISENLADGMSAEYQICLSSQPASPVQVLTQADVDVVLEPASVFFDPNSADWALPRTVTIQSDPNSDRPAAVAGSVSHFSISDDPQFSSELNPVLLVPAVSIDVGPNRFGPDAFEPNNALETAVDLGTGDQIHFELTIDDIGDEDWFTWRSGERGTLGIDLFFEQVEGDLELELYNSFGELIYWSASATDNEHVLAPALPGEQFFLRIFGIYESTSPNYTLAVHLNPDFPQIYVANDELIDVFDREGGPLFEIIHPVLSNGALGDLEIGPTNLIYAATTNGEAISIHEFTPRGTYFRSFEVPPDVPGELERQLPFGFDVLEDSSFLIPYHNAGTVTQVAMDGAIKAIHRNDIPFPTDATVLSTGQATATSFQAAGLGFLNPEGEGRYWAAIPSENAVAHFDSVGNEVNRLLFAAGEMPLEALPLDEGRLAVILDDGGNGRLRILDAAGLIIKEEAVDLPIAGLAALDFDEPARVPIPDDDGDGLLNDWETDGIDFNGDGIIDLDLPALGARPDHKDIFVELDTMVGREPLPQNTPIQAVIDRGLETGTVLDRVVESFLNAPVENLDGVSGIDLHILVDELDIPLAAFPTRWDAFDQLKYGTDDSHTDGRFGTPAERIDPNWENIREAKRLAYRYSMFADRIGETGVSGVGELPGDDFVITLGTRSTPGGTAEQQAGTFMHELGHTLGLRHGGQDDINFKPNYLSIMSYDWQTPNAKNEGWKLNFSENVLDPLDELALFEDARISLHPEDQDRRVQVGPLPFRQVRFDQNVDWNRNEQIDAGVTVAADINRGFADSNGDGLVNQLDESPGQLLKGHDDWNNLRFFFRDLQNFRQFRDGDRDRPEDADSDPSDLYSDFPPDGLEGGGNGGGNDEMDDATCLEDLESIFGLTIHSAVDIDWFKIAIEIAGTVTVGISTIGTIGSITQFSVVDADENPILTIENEDGEGFEFATFEAEANTTYYFRVESLTGSPTRYDLILDPGDYNSDDLVNAADIDLLCQEVRNGDHPERFDLNKDLIVTFEDIEFLVEQIIGTSFGDSTLDGIFNSGDLVRVFQGGEYEDDIPNNSGWETGDWDCDGEFSTSDLVTAFQKGGYVDTAVPAAIVQPAIALDQVRAAGALRADDVDDKDDDSRRRNRVGSKLGIES